MGSEHAAESAEGVEAELTTQKLKSKDAKRSQTQYRLLFCVLGVEL